MSYRIEAFNTAVLSDNKMHDDDVARTYGFRGGLVPGVDVYAYLTHVPAARWGLDWLQRGTISARFVQPVYDGEQVVVDEVGDDRLELRAGDRGVCAAATIGLPGEAATSPPPAPDEVPAAVAPARDERPPASRETLAVGTILGSHEFGFHVAKAPDYLADVRESLPLYFADGVAHPGWLLRTANYVLSDNVRLGPWIHVSSAVTHHGLVRDGTRLSTRARVTDLFERKGHRFVVLDVLIVADDTRSVMRVEHTAIYQPRQTTT